MQFSVHFSKNDMYFLEFDQKIIKNLKTVRFDTLRCHEEVIFERKESLIFYLKSLMPDLIVPSLIACIETNTIIDGHHRFHALKELGLQSVPVTFIDYQSKLIKPYFDDRISKYEILKASKDLCLLPPKSSKHVIYDSDSQKWVPIHLISSLYSYSI